MNWRKAVLRGKDIKNTLKELEALINLLQEDKEDYRQAYLEVKDEKFKDEELTRLREELEFYKRNSLVTLSDVQKKRADEFASKFNITHSYGSYEELLDNQEIELIYIATPHSHHYEQIKLCLEYGKHVLCEKAFTINEKEAKMLLEIAEKGINVNFQVTPKDPKIALNEALASLD